tara:strand:+ start:84 stop:443 length:360 start_codon:yes stop_codon:yes gene_type:complete
MEKLKKLLKDKKLPEREAIKILEFYLANKKLFGRPKEQHYSRISLAVNRIKKTKKYKTLKEAVTDYMKSKVFAEHKKDFNLRDLKAHTIENIVNNIQNRNPSDFRGIMSLTVVEKKRKK